MNELLEMYIQQTIIKEKIKKNEFPFLSEEHKQKFNDYCFKAHVHPEDRERKAMFFILSGNNDLITKGIDRFYDFQENMVKFHPDTLEEDFEKFNFCSSSHALTKLALNLYNSGFPSLSINDTLNQLDKNNYILAIEAIKIRFE